MKRYDPALLREGFKTSYWSQFLIDSFTDSKERDLSNIVQCVSGFLSTYFGPDFAILFLNEIGVIKLGTASQEPKSQAFYNQLVTINKMWLHKLHELRDVMQVPAHKVLQKL